MRNAASPGHVSSCNAGRSDRGGTDRIESLFTTSPFVLGVNSTGFDASSEDGRILMVEQGRVPSDDFVWIRSWTAGTGLVDGAR